MPRLLIVPHRALCEVCWVWASSLPPLLAGECKDKSISIDFFEKVIKGLSGASCSISTLITGLCKLGSTHLFAQGQGHDKENAGEETSHEQLKGTFVRACSQPDSNGACCCMSREVSFLSFFMAWKRKAIKKRPFLVPTYFFPLLNGCLGKSCHIDNNCLWPDAVL